MFSILNQDYALSQRSYEVHETIEQFFKEFPDATLEQELMYYEEVKRIRNAGRGSENYSRAIEMAIEKVLWAETVETRFTDMRLPRFHKVISNINNDSNKE